MNSFIFVFIEKHVTEVVRISEDVEMLPKNVEENIT